MATVALMARLTNVNATIAHVNHPLVVELVKREKLEGANLSVEVCPQYLFLNDEIVLEKGPFANSAGICIFKKSYYEIDSDVLLHNFSLWNKGSINSFNLLKHTTYQSPIFIRNRNGGR